MRSQGGAFVLRGDAVALEVRWSGAFRQPVGELKVDSATTLNYRPR